MTLPLVAGHAGVEVEDLQNKLHAQGISTDPDPPGIFADGTVRAIKEFQAKRDLLVTGICDRNTWSALVEASYSLGQRVLYRRSPMQRGDDVAALQRILNDLGFNAGRIDGIFGDATAAALADFQHNVGLPADGILGSLTLQSLLRVHTSEHLVPVSSVHESVRKNKKPLSRLTVAVAEPGGLDTIIAEIARKLSIDGASLIPIHAPYDSIVARLANSARADVLIGLSLLDGEPACSTSFYRGYNYESRAGKELATLLQTNIVQALGLLDSGTHGLSVPLLRESRMTAVLCHLGSPREIRSKSALLANAVQKSLREWSRSSDLNQRKSALET
jgi:N-acetylmuramoyl-L-alanine amidase